MSKAPFHPATGDNRLQWRIEGNDIQIVEFKMVPGTRLTVQPGAFLAGVGGVRGIGITWGRGLMDPLLRSWSGEKAVLQELTCQEEPARVVVGAPQLGKIVRIPLRGETDLIAQRGAFLASTGDIDIKVAFTGKLRSALFGGQGVVFQRLSGVGDVFMHALGSVIDWQIEQPGRIVRVSTNNILAFEETVGYDVQFSGDLMALMFGGQGLFLSQLEGPGRVVIQSVDHDAFVDASQASLSQRLKGKMRGGSSPDSSGSDGS